MTQQKTEQRSFFRDLFTDWQGKWSYGRVIGTLVLAWYMVMATYLAIETKQFPDIPAGLAMLLIGLYGINKAGAYFEKKNSGG